MNTTIDFFFLTMITNIDFRTPFVARLKIQKKKRIQFKKKKNHKKTYLKSRATEYNISWPMGFIIYDPTDTIKQLR